MEAAAKVGAADATASAPSVHLDFFPECDETAIYETLERNMAQVLAAVTLGRSLRNTAGIKVRTPLAEMLVHNPHDAEAAWLRDEELVALVRDELNVKKITPIESADDYISSSVKPEYAVLGKRFGKSMKQVALVLESLAPAQIASLAADGDVTVELEGKKEIIKREEVQILQRTRQGFVTGTEGACTIILDTNLTKALISEGMARDIVNRIQNFRKESGFEVSDRIEIGYKAPAEVAEIFETYGDHIRSEILAERMQTGEQADWPFTTKFNLNEYDVNLWMRKV
jgi:isoleucyl-tRNA synthetase